MPDHIQPNAPASRRFGKLSDTRRNLRYLIAALLLGLAEIEHGFIKERQRAGIGCKASRCRVYERYRNHLKALNAVRGRISILALDLD